VGQYQQNSKCSLVQLYLGAVSITVSITHSSLSPSPSPPQLRVIGEYVRGELSLNQSILAKKVVFVEHSPNCASSKPCQAVYPLAKTEYNGSRTSKSQYTPAYYYPRKYQQKTE
jgi:hypothetical protein